MRLLLVEDEKRLLEALECILKKHNYMVDTAYDGTTGQYMAETNIYDIIILDRMLPGKDGIQVLKNIRSNGIDTPVLFLTAKDSIEDRVEGLDAGADDYLVKPFATDELLARIRALGRRRNDSLNDNKLAAGTIVLDTMRSEAIVNNTPIKLTLKECQLLELFIRNKGQVIKKDLILDRVWGFDKHVEINNVEIYIHYLRRKLSSKNSRITIETIRGIGYCLKEVQ